MLREYVFGCLRNETVQFEYQGRRMLGVIICVLNVKKMGGRSRKLLGNSILLFEFGRVRENCKVE